MQVSRYAREKYALDSAFFSQRISISFPTLHSVRLFAQQINEKRDLISYPEFAVRASEINAVGLINDIFTSVIEQYKQAINPTVFSDLLTVLEDRLGVDAINKSLTSVISLFPPQSLYENPEKIPTYLEETVDGVSNKTIILEELLRMTVW